MTLRDENIPIPREDPYYYIDQETLSIIGRIHRISQRHPVNVLVAGRQGCGKSSIVRQYAAVYRRPLATFQVGILSEPGQLFGEYTLSNGETRYKQFLFPRALQTPNCVIHLEEINRPEHPKALNMLFSILSDDREVWMDELGTLKVADGVIFFATLNEGEEYIGTELLDPALRDRFYVILMDYLPNPVEREVVIRKTGVDEEQADQIISAINIIRGNSEMALDVSTRTTLMIGEMMAAGASLGEALVTSLQTDKVTLESILLSLHVKKGLMKKAESEYLRFCREVI
ncbi:MAG: AAA family ATPase [Deltaproteobacteria bacterium]|nr:AAA family ATPase [Deltaproteobacteria bacterium]